MPLNDTVNLALKIDVDTFRGTREGVPRLIELLERHGAGATFFFSLGPDHTGRAIKRALRPGFMQKVGRTSVVSHYGIRTLLYGTLLPGPDIGRRCAAEMRRVRDAGFEVGIHTWDHVKWQDGVGTADARWTDGQMGLAAARFREIFGAEPEVHGAAGWQMNVHAYRRTQSLGFRYASDTRGTHPFIPVIRAEIVACPQFPTTLPTLDELIGLDGVTEGSVAEKLLERTLPSPRPADPHPDPHPDPLPRHVPLPGRPREREKKGEGEHRDHVFTLHAELEGMKLAPAFEKLLEGWKSQGYRLVALRDLVAGYPPSSLPLHSVENGVLPGRSGTLACQGPAFLATESSP